MEYDLIVIGATFAGLGAAYAARDKVLVLESRSQIGYEFIGAYHPGDDWEMEKSLSAKGEELRSELVARGILSKEGKVYIPEVLPLIYHRVSQDNLPVLLMTEVIRVEKEDDCYLVEIYNSDGIAQLRAKRVLDTTEGRSVSPKLRPRILKKTINAMLWGGEAGEIVLEEPGVQILSANKKGEAILKLDMDCSTNYTEARRRLHEYWTVKGKEWPGWTIAGMGDCFGLIPEENTREISEGHRLLLSCSFSNPLAAFEAGVKAVLYQ